MVGLDRADRRQHRPRDGVGGARPVGRGSGRRRGWCRRPWRMGARCRAGSAEQPGGPSRPGSALTGGGGEHDAGDRQPRRRARDAGAARRRRRPPPLRPRRNGGDRRSRGGGAARTWRAHTRLIWGRCGGACLLRAAAVARKRGRAARIALSRRSRTPRSAPRPRVQVATRGSCGRLALTHVQPRCARTHAEPSHGRVEFSRRAGPAWRCGTRRARGGPSRRSGCRRRRR